METAKAKKKQRIKKQSNRNKTNKVGKVRQLSNQMSQKLTQLYYKPTLPSSLGGQQQLHDKAADIPQQLTKEWLSTQDAYTLHKTARKNPHTD